MFVTRRVLETATARALGMRPMEALQADAIIRSIGAVPLLRMWTMGLVSTERRVDQIEAYFDQYLHNPRGREELAGRVAVEACAVSMPDMVTVQGVGVWLLPEIVRRPVFEQLVLPLNLGIDQNKVVAR